MLDPQAEERLRAAIREAETHTRIEFVTVIARQSDGYYFIPTLWAALVALFVPVVLLVVPNWFELLDVVVAQLAVFSAITAFLRWSPIMYRVIPKSVLRRRASNMAHRQFLQQGVHRTTEGTGVLFFVSEAERYVEIIADSSVDELVDKALWQRVIDDFTASVKIGEIEQGYIQAVQALAEAGREVAPASRSENQLVDHLIVID